MDSLGDMLKSLSGHPLLRRAEEKKRKLLESPMIVKLREKYPELDDNTVNINLSKLHQYVTDKNNCRKCPGLENCPNDMPGHETKLDIQISAERTYIHDFKKPCKLYLAEQAQNAVKSRIHSFYMDDEILTREYSMVDILDKDHMRAKAAEALHDYIEKTRAEGLQKKGLYLTGNYGTGKTFMMGYMVKEFVKMGYSCAMVYMPDFVIDLRGMYQEPEKSREIVELLKEIDVLVFDDIGAESVTPWFRDHMLGTILNHRMNRKPTFYSTNKSLDELEEHYSVTSSQGNDPQRGGRIVERIRHYVQVVDVLGYNKRGTF